MHFVLVGVVVGRCWLLVVGSLWLLRLLVVVAEQHVLFARARALSPPSLIVWIWARETVWVTGWHCDEI
jgi:hypothetical protein